MTNKDNEKVEIKIDDLNISDSDSEFKVSGWGYRHQQCFVLFLSLTVAYSMRACMGVALVAMVDRNTNATSLHNGTNNTEVKNNHIFAGNETVSDVDINFNNSIDAKIYDGSNGGGILNALLLTPPYPKFHWNKKIQDTVLSSFFWGYMLLQIPAGQLAHRFGAIRLLCGALIINSLMSIILPWATYYGGWIFTMVCRITMGLSQACIVPGMHTFFGKWTPLEERGRLTAFAYGGAALGPVLGLPVTGFVAATPLGWPGIFRFYGLLSGIMAALLWWLAADTPAQHSRISTAERHYIEDALGQTGEDSKKKLPIPWKKILTCRGMYAIIVAHIGQTWVQLTLYSEVPAFMDKVMGVNIKANGLLSALPFLMMWLANFFFSWFTDMLIVKKLLSVTNTRKLANCLGSVPASIGLVALGYTTSNIWMVEIILIVTCSFKIANQLGFHVNHIDISPNFAGTMMSISNFCSNMVGSVAPLVAGFILTDDSSPYLWRKVFFVSSGLFFCTNLVYVALGTGEKADWNDPPEEKKEAYENGDVTEPMLTKEECKE